MTKKEIVTKISDQTDIKQIDIKKVVQMTLDLITGSLSKGETVELRNFGIFKVKSRKARLGRNPKTGQSVEIPGKKVVTFKAGRVMKEKVK
ncbi:MAG: integration host factor subunit beta [Candidatus Omnitrophica bacterium]|nr:integration host factor subunit beta [Candidatus Omnitrophota bacterium]